MKKIILTFLLVPLISLAANEKTVSSTIKGVTVYQQGAQVTRKANYSITKGTNVIIIEGVSPSIDARSLQVKTSGDAVLLDSKYNIFYPQPEINVNANNTIPPKIIREIRMLEDSISNVKYRQSEIRLELDVLESEKRIVANNGTIKGEGKVNDSIPLLKEALEFYHTKMNAINKDILELQRQQQMEQTKLNRMQNRLNDLNNYNVNVGNNLPGNKPPVHRIEITLSAKESCSGRIEVSYLVSNAGWIPLYDLRSNGSQRNIDLTYKAQVFQNTGVDWENVKLNLSTNNPYTNKTKPTLNPWYLDYYTHRQQEAKKSRSTNMGSGAYNQPTTAYNSNYESAELVAEDEVVFNGQTSADFTQVIEQLIAVEYEIDLPYDIKSDNQRNMVLVSTKSLETEYLHYAIPKLDLSVYLVARITDLESLNLVPGKANLFHNGTYLGETYLNPSIMSDTLDLSLGKDPNIVIKRTLLKKESKEKVVGDKIVKSMSWNIEIKNHKNSTTPLIIQDQIPVSRNSNIEVEVLEISKGNLNEISGIVTWNKKLKAGEIENIKLTYEVKYDKTQHIDLAQY